MELSPDAGPRRRGPSWPKTIGSGHPRIHCGNARQTEASGVDIEQGFGPVERDYEELMQELGLGHYEGRGWRGFHHHSILCIAAYSFLLAEPSRFPLGPRWTAPTCPTRSSTRLEATRGGRNAITRNRSQPYEFWSRGCWPVGFCVARYVVRFVYNTVMLGHVCSADCRLRPSPLPPAVD